MIAVITDVHANVHALKSAIEDIRSLGIETIYHLGDSIDIGPSPKETLELLMAEKVIMLMGNHEEYYLTDFVDPPEYASEGLLKHQKWVSLSIGPSYKDMISSFPLEINVKHDGVNILMLHYPANPDSRRYYRYKDIRDDLDENNIDEFFDNPKANIVIYGHHHKASDITGKSKARYICPGSLGCTDTERTSYLIIDSLGPRIREITYDRESCLNQFEINDVPEKNFIKRFFFGVSSEIETFLRERWGSHLVVTRGNLYDASKLPSISIMESGIKGLLTYDIKGDSIEMITLDSLIKGGGRRLINEIIDISKSLGIRRIWLITTNDNVPAMKFYKKMGFEICAIHWDSVEVSRKLKPEIPLYGLNGIPIRHEIEFELLV